MSKCTLLTGVSVAMLFCGAQTAHAASDEDTTAVLTVMMESAVSTASLMSEKNGEKLEDCNWEAVYSSRDWTYRMHGRLGDRKFSLTMSGFLWLEQNSEWLITFAGSGQTNEEALHVNGKATVHFDAKAKDHTEIDFVQSVKFGDHSVWGWVVGSEIVFGGIIGGSGGVAAAPVTGGATLPIGIAGALAGASAAVNISTIVRGVGSGDVPPPPPLPPERPSRPHPGQEFGPRPGFIYTAVSREGELRASGFEGFYILRGKSSDGRASGNISSQRQ